MDPRRRVIRNRNADGSAGITTSSSWWTRNGKQVDYWPQYDKLFEMKCGRGPHKIKISPYDPEKHVWMIDDQLHMIYKFTYDRKQIVMTLGTKGQRGRDGGRLFDRPTDIDWLPDGTFFISDGYGGHARREIRQGRQVPDGLGHEAQRSE